MNPLVSTEVFWLCLTLLMTALFWTPYILNRMAEHGIWPALYNPEPDIRPKAQWAERMMRAHTNAVENLVVFAPLVILVEIMHRHSAATSLACLVYFFARFAHYFLYTFRVPVLRTGAFLVGFICQIVLVMAII